MLINDLIETSFAMRIEILSIGYKAGYNMFKMKNTSLNFYNVAMMYSIICSDTITVQCIKITCLMITLRCSAIIKLNNIISFFFYLRVLCMLLNSAQRDLHYNS